MVTDYESALDSFWSVRTLEEGHACFVYNILDRIMSIHEGTDPRFVSSTRMIQIRFHFVTIQRSAHVSHLVGVTGFLQRLLIRTRKSVYLRVCSQDTHEQYPNCR